MASEKVSGNTVAWALRHVQFGNLPVVSPLAFESHQRQRFDLLDSWFCKIWIKDFLVLFLRQVPLTIRDL